MPVPLLDLTRENGPLEAEIQKSIQPVLTSSQFILGKTLQDFEAQCLQYFELENSGYCVGVSSGTDAQLLALMLLDLPQGSNVVVPPFTFFSTAGVVDRLGLKVAFADIEEDTFNMDPAALESAINKETSAVMPVHLFGQCADMNSILAITGEKHLPVIEDTCQSMGARYHGKLAGTIGDFASISYFPTKNLGAFGDAGMLLGTREDLHEKAFRMRVHGMLNRYEHLEVGGNFRMDALQAAVLQVKLPLLNGWHEGRRKNAKLYRELFAELGIDEEIILPVEKPHSYHIYNQFIIRVKNGKRDALKAHLDEKKIGNMIYYPSCLHLQPCFEKLGYQKGDFPVSEKATEEVLALPIHYAITEAEIREVVSEIKNFYNI